MVRIWRDHRAELGKGPVCPVEVRAPAAIARACQSWLGAQTGVSLSKVRCCLSWMLNSKS